MAHLNKLLFRLQHLVHFSYHDSPCFALAPPTTTRQTESCNLSLKYSKPTQRHQAEVASWYKVYSVC